MFFYLRLISASLFQTTLMRWRDGAVRCSNAACVVHSHLLELMHFLIAFDSLTKCIDIHTNSHTTTHPSHMAGDFGASKWSNLSLANLEIGSSLCGASIFGGRTTRLATTSMTTNRTIYNANESHNLWSPHVVLKCISATDCFW